MLILKLGEPKFYESISFLNTALIIERQAVDVTKVAFGEEEECYALLILISTLHSLRGVPQESILTFLLKSIIYDEILRSFVASFCSVFADEGDINMNETI